MPSVWEGSPKTGSSKPHSRLCGVPREALDKLLPVEVFDLEGTRLHELGRLCLDRLILVVCEQQLVMMFQETKWQLTPPLKAFSCARAQVR